jgi:hypothetical protein
MEKNNRINNFLRPGLIATTKKGISKEKDQNQFEKVAQTIADACANASAKTNIKITTIDKKNLKQAVENIFRGYILDEKKYIEKMEQLMLSGIDNKFFRALNQEILAFIYDSSEPEIREAFKHVAHSKNSYDRNADKGKTVWFGTTKSVENIAEMVVSKDFQEQIQEAADSFKKTEKFHHNETKVEYKIEGSADKVKQQKQKLSFENSIKENDLMNKDVENEKPNKEITEIIAEFSFIKSQKGRLNDFKATLTRAISKDPGIDRFEIIKNILGKIEEEISPTTIEQIFSEQELHEFEKSSKISLSAIDKIFDRLMTVQNTKLLMKELQQAKYKEIFTEINIVYNKSIKSIEISNLTPGAKYSLYTALADLEICQPISSKNLPEQFVLSEQDFSKFYNALMAVVSNQNTLREQFEELRHSDIKMNVAEAALKSTTDKEKDQYGILQNTAFVILLRTEISFEKKDIPYFDALYLEHNFKDYQGAQKQTNGTKSVLSLKELEVINNSIEKVIEAHKALKENRIELSQSLLEASRSGELYTKLRELKCNIFLRAEETYNTKINSQGFVDILNHGLLFEMAPTLCGSKTENFNQYVNQIVAEDQFWHFVFVSKESAKSFAHKFDGYYSRIAHKNHVAGHHVATFKFEKMMEILGIQDNGYKPFSTVMKLQDVRNANLKTTTTAQQLAYDFKAKYFSNFIAPIKLEPTKVADRKAICEAVYGKRDVLPKYTTKSDLEKLWEVFDKKILGLKIEDSTLKKELLTNLNQAKTQMISLLDSAGDNNSYNDKKIFVETAQIMERIVFSLENASLDNLMSMIQCIVAQDFNCCIDGIRGRMYAAEILLSGKGLDEVYDINSMIDLLVKNGTIADEFMKLMRGNMYGESASYSAYLQKLILRQFTGKELLKSDLAMLGSVRTDVEKDFKVFDEFISKRLSALLLREMKVVVLDSANIARTQEDYEKFKNILERFDVEGKVINNFYDNQSLLEGEISNIILSKMIRDGFVQPVLESNTFNGIGANQPYYDEDDGDVRRGGG